MTFETILMTSVMFTIHICLNDIIEKLKNCNFLESNDPYWQIFEQFVKKMIGSCDVKNLKKREKYLIIKLLMARKILAIEIPNPPTDDEKSKITPFFKFNVDWGISSSCQRLTLCPCRTQINQLKYTSALANSLYLV